MGVSSLGVTGGGSVGGRKASPSLTKTIRIMRMKCIVNFLQRITTSSCLAERTAVELIWAITFIPRSHVIDAHAHMVQRKRRCNHIIVMRWLRSTIGRMVQVELGAWLESELILGVVKISDYVTMCAYTLSFLQTLGC